MLSLTFEGFLLISKPVVLAFGFGRLPRVLFLDVLLQLLCEEIAQVIALVVRKHPRCLFSDLAVLAFDVEGFVFRHDDPCGLRGQHRAREILGQAEICRRKLGATGITPALSLLYEPARHRHAESPYSTHRRGETALCHQER
jgi:hypothetical protein